MTKKTTSAPKKGTVKAVATKSKKTVALKKPRASKLTQVMPVLTATVEFRSCRTGEYVTRTYQVTKADINDVDWCGGNCGDYFFDNEFETDEDRFEQRLEDCVHGMLWEGECDGEPVEAELNGDQPDGLGYHDRLDVHWHTDFEIEDFYPV